MHKAGAFPLRFICLDLRNQGDYIVWQPGITMYSRVTRRQTLALIKAVPIDLIYSQRQRLAIWLRPFSPEQTRALREKVLKILPEGTPWAA